LKLSIFSKKYKGDCPCLIKPDCIYIYNAMKETIDTELLIFHTFAGGVQQVFSVTLKPISEARIAIRRASPHITRYFG
jgi:hypothetical protein